MSDEDKRALRDMLDEQLSGDKNGSTEKGVSTFGWAKGRITIADDFDAPLNEFKAYEK